MGIFGIGVVLAPALGSWVGGVLMDGSIGASSSIWASRSALSASSSPTCSCRPESGPRAAKARLAGDPVPFRVLAVGASSDSSVSAWDGTSNTVIGEIALALAAGGAFLWHEHRTPHPMLDCDLFSNGPSAAACVVSFVLGAGLFGSTYLLPIFVQQIQNLTPTQAGLFSHAGGVLPSFSSSPFAGKLSDMAPRAC